MHAYGAAQLYIVIEGECHAAVDGADGGQHVVGVIEKGGQVGAPITPSHRHHLRLHTSTSTTSTSTLHLHPSTSTSSAASSSASSRCCTRSASPRRTW